MLALDDLNNQYMLIRQEAFNMAVDAGCGNT